MNTICFVIVACHLVGTLQKKCVNFLDAMVLTLFYFKPFFPVRKDLLVRVNVKLYQIVQDFLAPNPGVCDLADIFIILLFNVNLALFCCFGCLKCRNVRQGPYYAKRIVSL